jgi:PAS domain S-box-containing protein
MPAKNRIQHTNLNSPLSKTAVSLSIFNKPVLLSVVVFFVLIMLFTLLVFQRYQLAKEKRQKDAFEVVLRAKDKLQVALTHSFAATKMLALLIDKEGGLNNFDSIAAQVLETGSDVDAVQLVPEGIIKYIYPLSGNEKAIGYNILQDSARNKEAYKAIEQKTMYFGGPFELRQGGIGVVGRLPVYRKNKFWGFSAAVIKMETLYKVAGIDSSGKNGYYFQLSKINPSTNKEEFFLPLHKELSHNHAVSVEVPNGAWKLSVYSAINTHFRGDIVLLALLAFLFSVLGALFTYRFAINPKKLKDLVRNKTSELNASEKNYRSVIERVSDAFVALDNNWLYTYVNEKAGEILGRDPQSLIGKNIWEEFPQALNQHFYDAYNQAMQSQEYQYLNEYYAPFDKWLENHIYPSKDGLTVFFKDVTDIKQITLALKQKEEKYRTLIEHASDGIVITDLEGVILEVNKSIQQMIDFADDEMIGYHLTDFLPIDDIQNNPLRIYELMQGKSLLYERRLKKKDGTFLDVEINSKMATTHTLIGFIRDITERKKIENKLTYQASLLESVSDAVISLGANQSIVSWNSASEDLYGFLAAEVIGKKIPALISFKYPNNNYEEVFKLVLAEGKWKGEFSFIHPKTKEKINLLSSVNLIKDNAGTINGFIITSKNITDRIKTEKEIRTSNERFELIAQATNDAIWDHDFVKNETWGNKNLYNIYGLEYGKDKINFEMFLSKIQVNQRIAIQENLENAISKSLTSISEEFLFETANAGVRNFYDRAYIKYDSDGKPLRILGAMQDVTERETARQQIVKEKELSDTIINSLPGIFYLYNKTGKFLRWNKNFETVTGYSNEEMKYLHPLELFDEPDRTLLAEKIANVFATGRDQVEADFKLKSGEKIPYYFTGQAIDYEGENCLMGVGLDFSERKKAAEVLQQSEQKYRLLFYNNPSPMWMTSLPDMNIIDVNEAAIKQYGYSKEEFLKLNLRDIRPAEDVNYFISEIENIDLGVTNNRQWRHQKKNGEIIQVEVISHEIIYEGKRVWLSLPQDITEKHLAKELLQKSYDDIRQLASNLQSIREDERTTIAREIHDELGQQLTGLKMDVYWLSRKINSTDIEVTNKLNESIELINATVSSVRKIATDLRPSILDDLGLTAALEWQGEEFEKRSGTLVEFINEAGDVLVNPDAVTAVFRIYQELLTNVARHANASIVKVLLQKKDNNLFFSVTDNGKGFAPDSIKKKKTLGLLGIKERTLLLGGTYEFKSKLGQGSETIISIPLI